MIEKSWPAVAPVAFTATGTTRGRITVTSARGFKVKQLVNLNHPTQPDLSLEVKRVLSDTQLELGSPDAPIEQRADLSLYDNQTFIYAMEQKRPWNIPLSEIDRATYEEEPTVARRVIAVDPFGKPYSTDNPLSVKLTDGSVNIETLNAELRVQLSAKDNDPKAGDVHSSVRLGDGTNELAVNPDGSLNVNFVQSGSPGLLLTYNEVTAVASGAETTIISMVIPPSGFRLMKVDVSGENLALFRLKINGITMFTRRSWWNHFNEQFNFEDFQNGLKLTSGQILTVTVLHNRPVPGNFEATVLGV